MNSNQIFLPVLAQIAIVVSRMIHAFIHMGSNNVPARFSVFTIGFVIMVLMTIYAASILISA
jgi:hypothetical protein